MALDPVVNFFQSEIATLPVASGGTSIVISSGDGAKLPDPAVDGAYNLTIYEEGNPFSLPEIVRVTTRSSDTLTVTRAQEGTTATTKTAGTTWKVVMFPTAKTIQDIDTAKLDVADVVNNLTSTDTDKALSANQGKVLQDGKEPADATILKQANIVDNLTSTSTTAPLSANQGKVLQDGKLNLSGGTMTGDLTIPDKIIHSGDTNTAIRFPSADTVSVETNGVERLRVDSSGRVGIGTTPSNWSDFKVLQIGSTGCIASDKFSDSNTQTFIGNNTYFDGAYKYIATGSATAKYIQIANEHFWFSGPIGTAGAAISESERMRITSAGNVGIGTTAPVYRLDVNDNKAGGAGIRIANAGAGNPQVSFDNPIGTQKAAITYIKDNEIRFFVGGSDVLSLVSTSARPSSDNNKSLGTASFRWSEVFAGNATINTSDVTEKQDIAELNEAEQQVATALKGLIRKYRWISSVEQKGDDARIHVGVMAQDVAQAFEDAGLDAHRYGVFCEDTWYTKEETYTEQVENPDFDEEAEEGEDNLRMIDGDEQTRIVPCEADDLDATEHVRYGVRYDQLWAFIIAGL